MNQEPVFNIGTFIYDIYNAIIQLCTNLMNTVGEWEGGTWIALLGGTLIIGLILASIIRG